ncbi:amyloid beta protein binding protein 1 [Capronia epimyces CBS 606.96]|uniref:NEDD8-activating enzyme E1 regulatory subunit n=1 Tax=Capronia epimyces CBS 606.96 TaxID=1182542 RepID=W9XVH6_9EURO|nr:amyloid beta protein binding protein 1 [Capronia epimyces CBS 606.96]EXJ84567.1 amyloid beta protein binding protein 1 [Capronia epimyces CBS 606.96]
MTTEIAPRDVTPPPLQAPTAKEKKYDRQLRLWAASGQRALEDSHVLLIVGDEYQGSNSSVAGVEALKNLVLPSVGSFTIADSAQVTVSDLGVNFFLDSDSLHKSRAEETRRLLSELNPDVTGHAITTPLAEWLPVEGSLKPYNLIIACAPIPSEILQRICFYALQSSIPAIYVQSAGFYASFSIQLPSAFPIVDTHPDPESTQDLRLLAPWPELDAAVDSLGDISSLPDHDHGHIPYILILLYFLREWKANHNGNSPSTFKEKTEFRDLVRSRARVDNPEGGEENFDEACAAVLKSITPPPIDSGCKEMMAMHLCTSLSSDSANFWVIANAIKQFYETHGVLPLPGSLPDMKATSAEYIKLQSLYKAKARSDVAEVTTTVRHTESLLSRETTIPESEIEAFCRNASHVRVLTNPAHEPFPSLRLGSGDHKTISRIASLLENDWEALLPVFVGLNARANPSSPLDVTALTSDPELLETLTKATAEVERVSGGELHNISSVIGGMVAQEAIKLLTRQYVPVDGTCVFDGIRSKSGVYKI